MLYLITGKSHKLIDKEIKKIVKQNKFLTFNMKENDASLLFEECGYSFFLDEKKYIVVKNFFTSLKEKDEERLLKYMEKPNSEVVLIFTEEKVDARKKIIKKFKKDYSFNALEIDYKNIYDLVNRYITENNFKYDYNVVKYLVNMYGLEFDLIANELDKVFIYYKNPELLTINKIESIVSTPLNSNSFKFVDAVILKDLPLAKKLLNDLLIYKTDESSLITLLAREYRLISYVKTFYEQRESLNEIMKKLKMLDWQVQKYYKSSLMYSKKELNEIIKSLADTDEGIKTGLVDKTNALEIFLLSVCS